MADTFDSTRMLQRSFDFRRSSTHLRTTAALMSGAALGVAMLLGATAPAEAYYYYPGYGYVYGGQPTAAPQYARKPRPAIRSIREGDTDKAEKSEKSGKKKEVAGRTPQGPLSVMVSLGEQRVRVYDAIGQIAESPISSGTKQFPTFTGVFTVLEKHRHHFSNLYHGAPMPYMQRLTWSGTAMHTGVLPGYPASHGCIRLPNSFASQLWGLTSVGTRVVVSPRTIEPTTISHGQLALLKNVITPATPIASATSMQTASAETATATDAPNPAETVGSAPVPTGPLVEYGPPRPFRPGPISIFVSKREGKLFVRKGFEPIYEFPVRFPRPELALGTHVFTAVGLEGDGRSFRWTAVSMPGESRPEPLVTRMPKGKKPRVEAPGPMTAGITAQEALERIEIPAEVLDKLNPLMTTGASLIVSDKGLGSHTGKGTEFIVITR